MFEHHQYEPKRRVAEPSTPTLGYTGRSGISEISLLVWGEHCIECAAPACYTSCDLYDARPDRRCRRFEYGAYTNRAFSSFRGYGTEIQFRKWGKIEARGNTSLAPLRSVLRWERMMNAAFKVMNPVGELLRDATKNERWSYMSHSVHERFSRYLHARKTRASKPDAFLLEVYNPGIKPVTLHFMISPAVQLHALPGSEQLVPSFRARVVLPSGYSRHELDARLFRSLITSRPFDLSLTPEADTQPRLVFLSADFVKFAPSARESVKGKQNVKCVVWDLDNTLWDGVLLENPAVTLKPGIVELLHYLDGRGVLLSIASKNEHDSAWEKLREFNIADLFLHPQINWMPKSQNVKKIAQLLDIGIDTFAFVDDNPFELEEVKAGVPEILCIDSADVQSMTLNERMQGNTTSDARARRVLYQQAIVREQDESRFGDDYLGFLASCGITLNISPYTNDDLERISELVQRTNQLNFSGHRYTRSELYAILENSELDKYVLKCNDKYGSYGTIGFSIVRATDAAVRVEDFMVSCRVQGKFLEHAFFDHLLRCHNSKGAPTLWVNFQPTIKNVPARKVLETLGFNTAAPNPGMTRSGPMECDFIKVACSMKTNASHPLSVPDSKLSG